MKEQTRMDYDLYLESRRLRNEQINIMLDRLRELDHRDEILELKYKNTVKDTPKITPQKPIEKTNEPSKPQMRQVSDTANEILQQLQKHKKGLKIKETKENVATKVQEEKLAKTIKNTRTPIERIEHLVVSYLSEHGESPIRNIRKFVEETVNSKWANFSDPLQRVMDRNPRVRKSIRRGYYYLKEK